MSDYALFVNSLFLCLSCRELVVGKLQFKARKHGVSTLGLDSQ